MIETAVFDVILQSIANWPHENDAPAWSMQRSSGRIAAPSA
jgi:hypothetical protein